MAIDEWYDWYQQFREENQRQMMEYRRETQQWIASLKKPTEATARSQEETRSETNQSFEILCELIRGMTAKEMTPSGVLEDGFVISSIEQIQPRNAPEDDGDRPREEAPANCDNDFAMEIDEIVEPSQEPVLGGPSWNFDIGGSEFSVDDLKDRKVEFEPVQIGQQRTPSIHPETSTKNSQAINGSDFLGDPTILWSTSTDVMAIDAPRQELVEKTNKLQTQSKFSKVTFDLLNSSKIEVVSQKAVEVGCVNHVIFDGMEKMMTDCVMNSIEILGIHSAYQVFEEMPGQVERLDVLKQVKHKSDCKFRKLSKQVLAGNLIFDPGIVRSFSEPSKLLKTNVLTELKKGEERVLLESDCLYCPSTTKVCEVEIVDKGRVLAGNWIFDEKKSYFPQSVYSSVFEFHAI